MEDENGLKREKRGEREDREREKVREESEGGAANEGNRIEN